MSAAQAIGVVAGIILLGVMYAYSRGGAKEEGVIWRPQAMASVDPLSGMGLARLRTGAAVLDPELMQDVPQQYNTSFLNPCWDSEAAGKLRCLPYVYVSGFHTGAGSLARRLSAHPNILMDAGSLSSWGPTWGFWSEYRNSLEAYLEGIDKVIPKLQTDPQHNIVMDGSMSTFALYWAGSGKAHRAFSAAAVACWRECDREFTSVGPSYEACMDTKCLPAGREADQMAAVNATVPYSDLQLPMLMRALYGDRQPKFVLLLRRPTDRIHSAYFGTKHLLEKYGNHSEGFIAFVADQVGAYRECVARHSEEDCIMRFETMGMKEEKVYFHCDQILRGMYAPYLKVWFRYFPRSSFLILDSRRYFRDSYATMTQVLNFLGLPVPHPNSSTYQAMVAAGPRVSNVEARDLIPEGARRILSKLYEKHVEDLAVLLGDQQWLDWLDHQSL